MIYFVPLFIQLKTTVVRSRRSHFPRQLPNGQMGEFKAFCARPRFRLQLHKRLLRTHKRRTESKSDQFSSEKCNVSVEWEKRNKKWQGNINRATKKKNQKQTAKIENGCSNCRPMTSTQKLVEKGAGAFKKKRKPATCCQTRKQKLHSHAKMPFSCDS